MANNTFIQVPNDVTDVVALHRFLARLVEQLDVAFGERASLPFATVASVTAATSGVVSDINSLQSSVQTALANVASASTVASLSSSLTSVTARTTVLENNLEQPSIASLALVPVVPGATYVQAQSQALATSITTIETKVNDILDALKNANIISN